MPNDYRLMVGLACQTVVEDGMYLTQIPVFPANKATYDLEKIRPVLSDIVKLYPELTRCLGCNTCTKACPQDLDVMNYMAAAMRGDVTKAADMSFDCLMCGLCAARCPAETVQYNIAILLRRLHARHVAPRAKHLASRVGEILDGAFDQSLDDMTGLTRAELEALYNQRDIEPE
jgi:CO dehydrogenase/acetyl-CoA synthase alpha subunit